MSRLFKTTLAIVVVLVSLVPPRAGTGDATAARGTPKVGAQFHALWGTYTWDQRLRVLDKLKRAGIKWVRIDFGWSSAQPRSRGSFARWYVRRADRVVAAARKRNIKVLLSVGRTPSWANGGRGPNVPPLNYGDFGNLAHWLARHFEGRIAAYGIYNEPNHSMDDYWTGTAADYARLLRASYGRFKAADPGATIVAGNVVYNDDAWIREMYLGGAKGYFDVIGTHPYPGVADEPPDLPDNGTKWRFTHVRAVHKVMCDFGDCGKPIWFTEFGWSSHPNSGDEANWERGVTKRQQARFAVRAIKLVRDRYPYVKKMFWYTERNRRDHDPQHNNLGLLTHRLRSKPVYRKVKDLLR